MGDSDDDSVIDSDEEEVAEIVKEMAEVIVPNMNLAPSDPSAATQAGKQGYLEMKIKKGLLDKWKLYWFILEGGTLHIYSNYEKADPKHSIALNAAELLKEAQNTSKQFCFGIKEKDAPKWISASNAQEMTVWWEALQKAKTLDPSKPPVRAAVPKSLRTSSPLFRAKKSIAGRAASSRMGEALLMKMFGEEIQKLFHTIQKILIKFYGKDEAKKAMKLAIRITLKITFLFEKKALAAEDVIPIDRPLREAFELLSKFYSAKMRKFNRNFTDAECFKRCETLLKHAGTEFARKLQPFLTPKNLNNIEYVFGLVTKEGFLQKMWTDPDLSDELDEIDELITAYTQFHI